MFNGDIICRSNYGYGTKFIFLIALEPELIETEIDSSKRIMNPIRRDYKKMMIPDQDDILYEQLEMEIDQIDIGVPVQISEEDD